MTNDRYLNLDANASYGVDADLVRSVEAKTESALNPSSVHRAGQRGRALIEAARESVARLVGAAHGVRIVFTSGATESNNAALFSPFADNSGALVISAVEHPSVLAAAEELERRGVTVTRIHPGTDGRFSPEDFAAAVSAECRLVSVMLANNETGQILPVKQIADAARKANPAVLVHCDAVQALGKLDFQFDELGADFVSVSSHKIGGLTGTGALLARETAAFRPLLQGGPQESRRRAGTENLFGITAFGEAALRANGELAERLERMRSNANAFYESLAAEVPDAHLNFPGLEVLGNTLSIRIPGIRADDLVVALDLQGILVSSGAACASGKPDTSHVLKSMGLSAEAARETVRFSVNHRYDSGTMRAAGRKVARAIKVMRGRAAPDVSGLSDAKEIFA